MKNKTELEILKSVDMNITNDMELFSYMSKREMFTTMEIVNSGFKTQFESNRTYFIDVVDIEWVSENTVVCYIYSKNIECSFFRTCSPIEFYEEMKKIFIPISEMYKCYTKTYGTK